MRSLNGRIRTGSGVVAAAALAVGLGALAPAAARADGTAADCNTQMFGSGFTLASCARQDADGGYVVTATLTYSAAQPNVTSCQLSIEGWTEGQPGDAAALSHSATDCTLAVRYGDTQRVETRYSTLPANWHQFYGLASFTALYSNRDGDTVAGWSPVVTATA
jgi:hypothetical protein